MRLQPENRDRTPHAGLYIHIPFCIRKCPYCDFYSTTDLRETEGFVDALLQELHLATIPDVAFDTIYIGGGTPSLLTASQLTRILQGAHGRFGFTQDVEVTMEINPGTVSLDSLKAFVEGGVNRVSLGVQSFDNQQLEFLGRLHSAEEARQAVYIAREAGIENLGFDLIYGIPNQTPGGWLKDLKEAVSYEPEHVSCYMLTYEEGTPLDEWRKTGRFQPLDEDGVRNLFQVTVDFLKEAGYEQYEVSNFARGEAFRSRHNQKYWCHAPYLGFGPSAHSFVEPKRWWNHRHLDKYLQMLQHGESPVEGVEELNENQLMLETLFLGLRTCRGIETLQFKRRYGVDFFDRFRPVFESLEAQGLVSLSFDRCALTMEGMLLSDTVTGMFADHMDHVSE